MTTKLKFPTHLRKMWSGSEVQEWLDKQQAEQEPVSWIYEDELPKGYPYDEMFSRSKITEGVRMFPEVQTEQSTVKESLTAQDHIRDATKKVAEPDTDTMLWDSVEPRKKAEQEPVVIDDEKLIKLAVEAGFEYRDSDERLIVRHSNGSWVSVGGQLADFAALITTPVQQAEQEPTNLCQNTTKLVEKDCGGAHHHCYPGSFGD